MGSVTLNSSHQGGPVHSHRCMHNPLAADTTLSSQYGTRMSSQLSGGRLIILDCFHHGKGEVLFILQQTLWISIFFAAAKTTIHTFTGCRIHHHGIPQRCLWSRGSLHTKWSQCSFPGITMFSNSLQNGPLNIRPSPNPNPGFPLSVIRLSVYLPGYLVPASRLCVTRAYPQAGTPSVTSCWLPWIPTPCLSGLPPPVAVIILSK